MWFALVSKSMRTQKHQQKKRKMHHGVYFQIVILLMFLFPSFKSILDNDNNRINDDDYDDERKAW